MSKPMLQIALDNLNQEDAFMSINQVATEIDVIEVGTILVCAEGKKVVGCFPIYSGEELVHAAGMIPMGIWGGQVNPSAAGQYVPIFICSIMRSCLEYGMQGKYKGISAVVMPGRIWGAM